jgi:CubicO group peptidase (beta-lactamase class C family)
MKLNYLIVFLLFSIQSVFGQNQNKAEKLDEILLMLHNQNQFNGSVIIAEKGNIIFKKSYGLANEETKQLLDENSIFELASVSKQFTAMAIVILKEKGKLSFDDKITKFIPELEEYKNVSIRNLLNHTSGIPDYFAIPRKLFDQTKINTNQDLIDVLLKNKIKPLFEPNTTFKYSNTGYSLLASVIEKASGKTYAEFVSNSIFKPLKMTNTFVYSRRLNPKKINNFAFGYYFSDDLKKNVLPDSIDYLNSVIYFDGIVGDGCVNSNVIDLLKWDRALYQPKLITKQSLREIFSPAVLTDGKTTGYGFGWYLEKDKDYGEIVRHSGGVEGYKTYIERHLTNDKTIIILQNYDNVVLPKVNIREILYNKPLTKVFQKQVSFNSEAAAKFIGDYKAKSDEKSIITITKGDNHIIYNSTDQNWNLKLYPASDTLYFAKESVLNIQIEFVPNGSEVLIKLYQNGEVIEEGKKL